ncbi:tandem-95 repeat protein [Roseivirga sp.]|uniref:tandem-95 repeat protein n=1 Tax=Roseivirga sp. TaxID=1964215 RepID=UPI003B523CED
MISLKRIFNLRYLTATLLLFVLAFHAQGQDNNDAAKNERMATTSGGWVSGGIYTSFISVGHNGISSLISVSEGDTKYEGNFGFIVPLIEKVDPNQAPVAVTAKKSIFYNLGDVLRLNGFDPDGDEIEFIITKAPEKGELASTGINPGRYTFTPGSDLLPGNGYKDTVWFKVAEVSGDMLESNVGYFPFIFNVQDEAHEITNMVVGSSSESAKTFDLELTDNRFNANYNVSVSYLDLSNPTAPQSVSIVDETFALANFTADGNKLTTSIGVTQAEYPYLFSAEQVVLITQVSTASGFDDDEVFVLENTGESGSGGAIRNLDTDASFFTDSGDDPKPLENTTSADGLFFSYASEKQTPENTSVLLNLYALELGDFDLSNASIAITKDPKTGTATSPVLVKSSESLAQWTVSYNPVGEIGYLDSLEFTVTSADRDFSVSSYAKVQVVDVNDAPTLSSVADQLIDEDEAGTVDLTFADVDSELSLTATSSDPTNVAVSVNGSQLTLTPASNYTGTVSITVLVEEVETDEGYSKLETFEVEVAPVNDSPIMAAITDQTIDEDNVFTYTLSASDVDAAVPLFTFKATPDVQGAATVAINGNIMTVTPAANYNGIINFSVTADDRLGTNTSVSEVENFALNINAVNDAPVATATIPAQTMLDELPAYIIDMGSYFEDVETADADLIITNDASGTLFTLSANGKNVTVSPISGQSGSEDVTFTVSDGELTVTQTVTFTVETNNTDITTTGIQDVAVDEDFTTYTVDLSGAFTDTGDANAVFTYTVGGLSNLSATVSGTDLILTTTEDFNGTENLFLIASANGKSSYTSFDIVVNPVNDAPSLGTASNQSIQEDGQLSGVFMTFDDIDTDAANLTFSATSSDESVIATSDISIVESASGITLSANTIANASGNTTINVEVSDGEFTASQSFSITVLSVNDAPTVVGTTIAGATEDAAYTQDLNGLFDDVDGDNLSFSLENNPDWLSVANGSLSGTPANEDVGSNSFFITASDGSGGTVRQEYTISVTNTNDAPVVASPAADITATEDVLLSSLIASSVFNDVDGDDLTLSASFSGADWLSFDAVNNRFTGTPTNDDVGTVNITITASDPDGETVSDDIVLTVVNVNDSPTDVAISGLSVDENSNIGTVIGALTTSDVDAGDSFTYELVDGSGSDNNDSFTISNEELVSNADIDFEAAATLSIRLKTTDAAGATFEKTFTVTVNNVNEAPTALDIDNVSIEENAGANAAIGALSSTDEDSGETFTYSLVTGTGDTDNASFDISNGELVAKNSFNFETKASYSVRLKTEDAGGLSFEKAISISVTNVNEAPTAIDINATSIDENSTVGSVIGSLSTTDEDNGDTFTYSLASGASDNDAFGIDGANLITGAELDFEAKSSYAVEVTSTDAGGASFTKSITINVNNVAEPSIAAIDGLVFEQIDIAETSSKTFTVENTGDTEIEVTSINLPDGYSANTTAFTVAVGSSTNVEVTFAPSEARTYAGDIVMQSTVGETRISVTGEGTIVTGIDDDIIDSEEVGLYPNPAQHIVTIDLSEIPQMLQPDLAIVDLSGTAVWKKDDVQERKVEVDVSRYPAGTYLVRVATERGSVVKKLIIIK